MKQWLIGLLVVWMAFQSVAAAARPVMPCCATECHDVMACAAMACTPACTAATALPTGLEVTAWTIAVDVLLPGAAPHPLATHIDDIWKPPR